MNCICPMRGGRPCPDNCVIAAWHSLPDDQKTQKRRRPIVKALAEQSQSQQAIAIQLGVSQQTIGRDLETLSMMDNVKGQGKDTLGRKKSTGRPRNNNSSKRPMPKPQTLYTRGFKLDDEQAIAKMVLDEGKTQQQVRKETGLEVHAVRVMVAKELGRREATQTEPVITPDMLSMSAQEKLDAAFRQRMRKFESECDQIVRMKIREGLENTVLPHYNEMYEKYKDVVDCHRGFMQRSTYLKILRCLHPDSRNSVSDERLSEAFRLFTNMERKLCPANEMPKSTGPVFKMPRTAAELDELKRKVSAENRARHTTKTTGHVPTKRAG